MIPTRFVLIETSHAGNVGAVARAMKVMGFEDLVLVRPRWENVLRREETIQRASGALDVLRNTRIVQTLDQALEGMSHLCATAMTERDFGPPTRAPREHLASLIESIKGPAHPATGVAFLFGSERFGMTNEDVYRCHVALKIPSNPEFGSLNIAAAVQLIAYEWRICLGGFGAPSEAQKSEKSEKSEDSLADAAQIGGLLKHWQSALEAVRFLDPLAPKKLMPRLNQLFNRAQMTNEEIHILRGVAKAMIRVSGQCDFEQTVKGDQSSPKTVHKTLD